MDAGEPSIDALLAAARAQFAASLQSKVAAIADSVARGDWEEARRAAHRLRGSAATYGYGAVGDSAAAVEEILLQRSDPPGDDTRAEIVGHLRVAAAEAERAASEPP